MDWCSNHTPLNFWSSRTLINHVLTHHASGHTLDLVLSPGDLDVDNFKVLPINSNIFDHDMVFFHVNFPKMFSFTKSITIKKYQKVADASHFLGIE